jgi:hypothetical protein
MNHLKIVQCNQWIVFLTDLQFDMKAANKEINADVCLDIGNNMSIKFHVWPLYKVCQYEKSNGCRVPVPENYFDSVPKQP